MTDLTGREPVAGEELAIDEQAGADALADLDEQEVLAGGVAVGELGQGGHVGVVGHVHGQAQGALEVTGQGHVVPAEVGRLGDHTVGVDHAGAADADAQDGAVGGGDELACQLDGEVHRRLADSIPAGDRAAVQHLAGEVDDGSVRVLVGAEVEGHDVAGVGDDADEGGRLADALAGPAPDLFHEPFVEEAGHQVGGRRGREAGRPGQVGAAQRAVTEQRLQDQAAVVAPGVLGHGLGCAPQGAGEQGRDSRPPTSRSCAHDSFIYLPYLFRVKRHGKISSDGAARRARRPRSGGTRGRRSPTRTIRHMGEAR